VQRPRELRFASSRPRSPVHAAKPASKEPASWVVLSSRYCSCRHAEKAGSSEPESCVLTICSRVSALSADSAAGNEPAKLALSSSISVTWHALSQLTPCQRQTCAADTFQACA
jgi:hypothetical protein